MLDIYQHWGLDSDAASMEMVQRRYIERLVGCIENVCNPLNKISRSEKLSQISKMISTERAKLAVEVAQPRSRMMQIMLAPIKAQNANLCYREGSFISFVKRHNTKMFATLKANR